MSNRLIPQCFGRVKTFVTREPFELQSGVWARVDDLQLTIDELIEAWRVETQAQILHAESPHVSLYSQSETQQLLIISLTVLYLPAADGVYDQTKKSSREASGEAETVEQSAKPAKSADEIASDIVQPTIPSSPTDELVHRGSAAG